MKDFLYNVTISLVLLLCLVPAAFATDGFGENTTDGESGTTVVVDNAEDFKELVEALDMPYIVQVSSAIDLGSVSGTVSIRSNKTIAGMDPNATITGQLGFKKGSSNIIIERLNITNPGLYGEGDGISLKEDINDVFITKCTLYDCKDGCLDITRRSDRITVSWCKFYFTSPDSNQSRVSLIGSSDDATDDIGSLHITFHHNWFGTLC